LIDSQTQNQDINNILPALLSVAGACQKLSLGRTKVYELIDGHEIEAVKIGAKRLITTTSIDAYVDRLIGEQHAR
jgi:excisionase family DNA binding protein